MRVTIVRLLLLIFAAVPLALILLAGQTVYAQQEHGERGYIELGIRQFAGDRRSSKFSEYRHIPGGFFLQRFELHLNSLLSDRFFLYYQTRETLEKDQTHLLDAGKRAKYRFQIRWDQTPHYFTNTAKSFFVQSGPGQFTVPAAVRTRLQTAPAEVTSFLEGAKQLDTRLTRKQGTGTLTVTPRADWTVQFQYFREMQTGVRPFGTTTNSFTHVIELPEPIDYRTHQVSAGTEYAKQDWGVQFGYSASIFKNKVGELVWDNPFRATDALNGGSRGRLDLYPDNSAHNLSIAGAVNLHKSTRVMASIVPGWMRQNDAFLPFTTNTAITDVPSLPAASLHGKKSTLAMNYTLSSSAIPALPLTVRYRSYDYDNDTPSLVFTNYVRADGSLSGVVRSNLPYAFDRKNLEANVSWGFFRKSSFKFGYEWERFDRRHRDVTSSDEHTVGAALDLIPNDRITFRTSYKHANREPDHYEANEESFPLGEPATGLGQIHDLRKYDEAARGRNRAEALLQIDPTDTLSLSASYGTTQDNYKQSLYGLLKDVNYSFSFDLTYSPHPLFSVFADYTKERYKYNQRSRQRTPPTATAPVNDTTNNDWTADMRDLVDTWGAGVEGTGLDNRVRFETYYSLSTAKGTIRTRALGVPGIPGFLVTTAQNYPDTSNRFHQVVGSVRLKFGEFFPKVEYRFEKYGRTDFQIDRLSPYMGVLDPSTATSIFLGADVPDYRVHIVTVSLGYRF